MSADDPESLKLSAEISACLNQIGVLALPKVIARHRASQTADAVQAEIRAALQGLRESLNSAKVPEGDSRHLQGLRLFCSEMLGLLDAHALGDAAITECARAFFVAQGFVPPERWAQIDAAPDEG